MKIISKLLTAVCLVSCMGLIGINEGYSQGVGNHLTFSIQNCSQTSGNTIQFDLYVVSDGATTSDLRANSFQYGINFNTGILRPCAVITPSYVSGSSAFIPPLNLFNFPASSFPDHIRIVEAVYGGGNTGNTMIRNQQYRVGTFVLTSTINFVNNTNPNLTLQSTITGGKTACGGAFYIGSALGTTAFSTPGTGDGQKSVTGSCSITLTAPCMVVVTASSNTPVCEGNDINLSSAVCGGTGPFAYSWAGPNSFGSTEANPNILSALPANSGNYTVSVTDAAGCIGSASTVVSVGKTFANYITNEVLVSPTIYEFDVYLLRTVPQAFEYAAGQWGISINSAVANGGTLTAAIVGNSDLAASQVPNNVQSPLPLVGGFYYYNIAGRTPPSAGSGTMISNMSLGCTAPGTRVATFRIINSVPFAANSQMHLAFNFVAAANATETKINAYLGGVNTDITSCGKFYSYNSTNTCVQDLVLNPNGGCTLVASASATSVSCFGGNDGTATVTQSGGTQPFQYIWSNGQTLQTITGLTAGTYAVTVTDGAVCTATASAVVSAPSALNVSCGGAHVFCNGGNTGSASVTASGGTTAYTYKWSNGLSTSSISSLTTGTYTVTVTDSKSCTITCSFNVTQPPVLSANCGGTSVSCNGGNNGSASVTANGGTTAYTYKWSSGPTTSSVSNLTTGTYTVTVTDSKNCTASCMFNVTQPPTLLANCGGAHVSCNGGNNGTASVTASGGTTAYTYKWSNGPTTSSISNLITGTYTVTVTDSKSCTITCSFNVTQPPALSANCGGTSVSCNGGNNGSASVTANGGTTAYTYKWSSGPTTSSVSNLTTGTYTVTVTDSKSCTISCSFNVTQPPALVANCGGTNVTCSSGGSASVTASGGAPNYTYSWDNNSTTSSINNLTAGTYTVTVTDSKNCSVTCSYEVTQPASQLAASCGGSSVSCNGGSNGTVSVTASGGSPNYSYLWSNNSTTSSISNLTAGTYSVTVTDAQNCKASCSFNVSQPPALSANCGGTPVSCNGGNNGSASVTASGGTTAYTYKWSNGPTTSSVSNLTAGTYTVTVTDSKSCTISCSFNVTQPPVLSANCSGTPVSCSGGNTGSASVTASGGTTAYTYKWSNGPSTSSVSNLIAGTYTVTVTDSKSCTITCSFNVTQPPALVANCGGTTVLCNGGNNGSASVTASGGTTAYTYKWSNGLSTSSISSLTTGTYTVTVTDSKSCTITCSFNVTQPPVLSANCSGTPVSCSGGNNGSASVTASGGTPTYFYKWSNGPTTSSISNLIAGTYTVTVTDSKSCTITCSFNVTQPPALLANCGGTSVSCNGGNNGTASVTASGGTTAYTYKWSNGPTTSSISNLITGTYTVTVTDSKSCTITCSFNVTQPPALVANCGGTNVTCSSGGSALVTASGGAPNYTYSWNNNSTTSSINNLTAGTYTVIVTDSKNCSVTCSYVVTQPGSQLSASCGGTHVSCNGGGDGTASVTASGGSPNYTYLWSNNSTTSSISTLTAGTYSVTVTDAQNCKASCSFNVSQPPALSANCSGTHVSCNGGNTGSASVTASGGTTAYTYKWSNGPTTSSVNNLTAGTYTVTVTDSKSCTITCSFNVTQPPALVVNCSGTHVTCSNGGSATISASGGTPNYTYSWNNNSTTSSINNLTAGTYTVVVTDSKNCTASCTYEVTQPVSQLTASCGGTHVSCNGGSDGTASVSTSGGSPNYTYLWSNNSTTSSISTLLAGTYSVTVTDVQNCKAFCSFVVSQPPALAASCSGTNVSVNGGSDGTASVSATGGTIPYSYSWSNGETISSINNLAANTYSVTVTDNCGAFATCSFTVTEPPVASPLNVLCSGTNISCNGSNDGSASVSASGGTPSYSYSWSHGETTSSISNLSAGTYTVTVTDNLQATATCSYTVTEPSALNASASQGAAIVCNGGTTTVLISASGGTAPYNGTGPFNLGAGAYTYTVTDGHGCTTTASITVTEPGALSVSCGGTDVTVNGGSDGTASVSASGGTSPFSYSWSTGETTVSISNLSAGTYAVTVTDNCGDSAVCSHPVIEPAVLSVSCSGTNISCQGSNDGTASVSANGGTSPYFYSWSTGETTSAISNLSAGTYTVTVTDNFQATVTCSYVVTDPSILNVVCSGSNISCNGANNGSVAATASGGSLSYSYLWSSGETTSSISGLSVNTYTVTVTDNCITTVTCSYVITEPSLLNASASQGSAILCNGATTTVTVSASGGTSPYNGTGNFTVSAGAYSYTVTDAHGCTAIASITVTEPNALNILCSGTDVTVNGGSDGSASVSASGGTSPYFYSWSNGETTSSASNLSANTYTVTVTDNCGATAICSHAVAEPSVSSPLNASCIGTDISCNGASDGTASVSASGGTSPYFYSWDNGETTSSISGLSAGVYTVTVSDNSGISTTATCSYTVSEPASLIVSAGSNSPVCEGNTLNLTSSGTGNPTYSWTGPNGFSSTDQNPSILNVQVSATGTYTLTVTDGGSCTASATINVTVNPGSSTCKICDGNVIVVDSNVTIDFNTAIPTYTGDLDLKPFFTYDKSGSTKDLWNAIFNVGAKKLLIKKGATITTSLVGGFAPGLILKGTCELEIEDGGHVVVNSFNKDAGDILIQFNGNITVNGEIRDEVNGTLGLPGCVTVASKCGDINVGQTGLILDLGVDPGACGITLLTCGESGQGCNVSSGGDIIVSGLVKAYAHAHSGNQTLNRPDIKVVAMNGAVTINANTSEPLYDEFQQAGTKFDIYGGLLSWVRDNVHPGKVEVQAKKDITVNGHGTDPTGPVRESFGAIAAIATASDAPGGLVDVRSIEGNIIADNRAFDVSGRNRLSVNYANIRLYAKLNIALTRSGANNNFNPVVDASSPSVGDKGGKNELRSYSGNITIGSNARVSAVVPLGQGSVQGINLLTSCLGITNSGTVQPADLVNGDDIGTCSPSQPTPLYTDCQSLGGLFDGGTLSVSCGGNSVSCTGKNNGSASVTASGGISPYSYSWNNGKTTASINGLSPGTYTVTVADASQTTTSCSFTVTEPPLLSASCNATHVSCKNGNNGSASVTVNGGSPSYTYKWNNGSTTSSRNGLPAGSYSVTVTDANGCKTFCLVTVTQPSMLVASSTAGTISCSGGAATINVTASGGTPPYSGTGAFTVTEGTYTYTVADQNNCTATTKKTVADGPNCINGGDEHCSYSQGFYGNSGGKTCIGLTTTQAITQALSSGSLVIGSGSRTLTILTTEVSCVIDKLPAGSGPANLPVGNVTCATATGSSYLKNGRFNTILIGQTLTLALNLRLDPTLGDVEITGKYMTTSKASSCANGTPIPGTKQTFNIPQSVINCLGSNNTVSDLLNLANKALGKTMVGCSASLGDINEALEAINEGFDKCRILEDFSNTSNHHSCHGHRIGDEGNPDVSIVSYPNPFYEMTNIEFVSDETSDVTVEIYNLTGEKVITLYQGSVDAGQAYNVSFDAKDLSEGVYLCKLTSPVAIKTIRLILIN